MATTTPASKIAEHHKSAAEHHAAAAQHHAKRPSTTKLEQLKRPRTMQWQPTVIPCMPSITLRKPRKATPNITPKPRSDLLSSTCRSRCVKFRRKCPTPN